VRTISFGGKQMSNWNRIGSKSDYTVTLVGTEKEWEAKKEEIEKRGQKIIREGITPSSFGIQKKYWAKVEMPSRSNNPKW
jgi:hypothetical protein